MSQELLMRWVAEIGTTTFDAFAQAHAWAMRNESRRSPYATLRMLSALAYVEVDWRERRVFAAPPAVTLLPDAAGHGLVVGARTALLTSMLQEEVAEHEAVMHSVPQEQAPDAVFLASDSESVLEGLARRLGIPYVHSVVEQMAAMLPSLDAELAHRSTPPIVRHYGIERFDVDEDWQLVSDDSTPGLYRYERSGPRAIHLLADHGRRFEVDLALGTWAEARRVGRDHLLWWWREPVNGTFDVPWLMPLPTLHARVASLCSGLEPQVLDGGVRYFNVPEWVAARIASSLGQQLDTEQEG